MVPDESVRRGHFGDSFVQSSDGRHYHVCSSEEKKPNIAGLLRLQAEMGPKLSAGGGFQSLSSTRLACPQPTLPTLGRVSAFAHYSLNRRQGGRPPLGPTSSAEN